MLLNMTLPIVNDRSVELLSASAVGSVLLPVGRLFTLLVLVVRVPSSRTSAGSDMPIRALGCSLGLVLGRGRGTRRRVVVVAAAALCVVALRGTRRRRVGLLGRQRVTVRVVLRLPLVVALLLVALVVRVHLGAVKKRDG